MSVFCQRTEDCQFCTNTVAKVCSILNCFCVQNTISIIQTLNQIPEVLTLGTKKYIKILNSQRYQHILSHAKPDCSYLHPITAFPAIIFNRFKAVLLLVVMVCTHVLALLGLGFGDEAGLFGLSLCQFVIRISLLIT